jgi:hypothetical protein
MSLHGEEPIALDAISTSPVEVPIADEKARREQETLAHERGQLKQEMGIVGRFVGGRAEKAGNISALVIVVCIVFFIAAYFLPYPPPEKVSFDRVIGLVSSLITLALGYLFGSKDKP